MGSFDNVTLLYQHPHISIYIEDNTGYDEEEVESSSKDFNGIQVAFCGSGRDNTLLYCNNTTEFLNEFGDPNYKLYGQAGYNAYNILASEYAGCYVLRPMPDNATLANTVIMAKYKLVDDTVIVAPVTGNDVMSLIGTNMVPELIPDEEDGVTEGSTAFTLSGQTKSGLTGDTNIDSMFSHITQEWLEGNNLGNFTFVTVKIPIPAGVVVGDEVSITSTSEALKKFYADFGEDPSRIVANADGLTATKTGTYSKDVLLEGNDYITMAILVAENDTVYLDINWGSATENIVMRASGITFVDEVVEEEVPKNMKLGVSFEAVTIEGATSEDMLRASIASMYNGGEPNEEGYYYEPLMAFWALGRGAYGSDLRVRFDDANEYDGVDDPTTRMYKITVMLNTKEGLKEKEYIYGMLDEDSFDRDYEEGPSLFLPDLVNDVDKGSAKIGMLVNSQVYEHMFTMMNSVIDDEDEKMDVSTFDAIFGLNPNGSPNEHMLLLDNTNSESYVNLVSIDGVNLAGGSDGDLDPATHTEEELEATREDLLIKAFRGELDKRIKSRYSAPADFCLDANFSDAVKRQMAEFALLRKYDCITYLDTKLYKTSSEVINYLKSLNNIYGYNIVKEMHCYKYRDRLFTGKSCEMSITHWFAKAFPTHVKLYGIGEPFARDRARLSNTSDFISNSFLPVIDPDDHDVKKQIYKYGANCYETVRYNVFQRTSAITTCKEKTDRLDEFNEYITERAVSIAHSLLASKLYHISEDDDRARFTEDAERAIEYYLAGLVKTCSVEFKMSKSDKKKNILRIAVRLTFYTVAKYGIVEIYLDPRVTDDETV